ncbi:CAP domain-containing protein [Streptomyces sp. GC420]|uniref:CAP domain-containing protein n=1 Tax=Streptomyces sp. GC420 TaxID=2697568 RepID=UPI0014151EF4|nr:CAP domain-containing protein [Streptomyces sp. GC420]NBM16973.1 stress protein [Streptomyces sp. GC420]
MTELVPGGNLPLPDGALTLEVHGPFDVSALITGDDGKVGGDEDFVFYNQPSAPGAVLRSGTIALDRRRLRAGASRVTVVVSPADPGTPLSRLPAPALRVTGPGGGLLARFTPPRPAHETVLLLAEVYRRGTGWKLRALGQGYASGLAGVARDFGVEVSDDGSRTGAHAQPPVPARAVAAAHSAAPAHRPAAARAPARTDTRTPVQPLGPTGEFAGLVNSLRARAGLPRLSGDERLGAAARTHAAGMAAQGRLGSTGPDGTSLYQQIIACGYAYLTLAEHLVSGPRTTAGFLDFCLAREERSRPVHDPSLRHVGVAHALDARSGDMYWTAVWAQPFGADGLARTTAEVVALTNRERSAAGLRPLAADPRLATAAQAYSGDMAARGFYSHTSPEGLEPWDRARAAGCTHRGVGENIACGQRSAAEVVRGWMDSPGHRANILRAGFTHIGVGFAGGGPAGTYWTQLFGKAD